MKIYLAIAALLSAFMMLFPLACVGIFQSVSDEKEPTYQITELTNENNDNVLSETETIKLLQVGSGKVIELELYDYVIGAVAGEMPASYEKEALKAQAVACYTYAMWLKQNSDNFSLSGADISDDPATHQSYLSEAEMKEKWGNKFDIYNNKIKECVNEVMGQYLSYNNEPALTCYHAVSPGKTSSAEDVWNKKISYLTETTAPGDSLSPDIDSTVTLNADEFLKLCNNLGEVKLGNDKSKWVGKAETTDNGFVLSIKIGGKSFNGNEVRAAFSLKSPYFTLKYSDSKFTFNVKGYGHGLGMSQNSADYMARQGCTYDEILMHFYSGVTLVKPQ